jgi:hypothetical protein
MKKARAKKHVKRVIRTRKGNNMLKGPWTLISPNSLEFAATLVETINEGRVRLAIFRVPKVR